MKKVLFLLLLVVAAALPSLALAENHWSGAISSDWENPANWNGSVPHNAWYTELAIYRWYHSAAPPNSPVIDSSVDVTWDCLQIEGGPDEAVVQQTGGSVRFLNYTSHLGLALTRGPNAGPAKLVMTGGSMTADQVGLGYNIWDGVEQAPGAPINQGNGIITIGGDAVFTVEPNTYGDPGHPLAGKHCLWIHDTSYIDIREDGELHVPVDLTANVDAFIAAGKILNTAGAALVTETIGGEYVVSCVPEPGTLLLLCLGLGSLALIRRR